MKAWFEGRQYTVVTPQADTDEIALKGDRLLLVHDQTQSHLMIVPRGDLYAGWVVGVFE